MPDNSPLRTKLNQVLDQAETAYSMARMELALRAYERARELEVELGVRPPGAYAAVMVGVCLFHLGRADESLAAFGEIIRDLGKIPLTADESRERFRALTRWLWVSLHYKCRKSALEDMLIRARVLIGDWNRPIWGAILNYIEGVMLEYRGQLAEAIDAIDRALAMTSDDSDEPGFAAHEYQFAAAMARLDAGVNDDVVRALGQQLLSDRGGGPYPIRAARAYQVLSRSALSSGDVDLAYDLALRALGEYRLTQYKVGHIQIQILLSQVHRAQGKSEESRAAAQEAVRISRTYHSELMRFDAAYCLVEAEGSPEAVRKCWEAAQGIDPRLGTTFNGDRVKRFWQDRLSSKFPWHV